MDIQQHDALTMLLEQQMQEWQDLRHKQKQERAYMETQLTQKYGRFPLAARAEKKNQRELLSSLQESNRIGLNAKHLYQSHTIMRSNNPISELNQLISDDHIDNF